MQPPPVQPAAPDIATLQTVVVTLAVIAALYLGAGILVPLVLAVLLAFALAPLVGLLEKLRLPDVLAVLLAVGLAVAVLGSFAYLIASQLMALASDLPGYQTTVSQKLRGLQDTIGGSGGLFERASQAIESLGAQLGEPGERAPSEPVPVVISNDSGDPLGMASVVLGSVLRPLATAAIVTIFLIFLLLGRTDMRDRFIRLVSRGNFSTTTLVINDSAARVGRYLLVQFSVNVVYGIIFGTGLHLIGVPNALLWGLMAALFRYIPFVGTFIIASIPFALAFAIDPGWNMLLMSVALFSTLELITTNAIEPRLYGSSTGLSPLAVLLAAMFWATLWGPIGLILSTPITVCLVVLGRYVPQLSVLETLLGSEPVLTPRERLYQRLLAGDVAEATEVAGSIVEEKDERHFYEAVLLPALKQASVDLSHRPETVMQRRRLWTSLDELLAEVGHPPLDQPARILLVGGKTELDEGAARIVQQLLAADGIAAEVLPPMSIRQESIGQLDLDGVDVVCLCYLGAGIRANVRYAARRLRRIKPDLKVIVSHLNDDRQEAETAETLRVDEVAHSLDDTQIALRDAAAVQSFEEPSPTTLEQGVRGDPRVEAALADIAEDFGMPVATLNLLDDERHREDAGAYALTQDVASERRPVVVMMSDEKHPLTANQYLVENGVEFYAAVPLTLADGRTIGSLAVLDYEERPFGDEEVARLAKHAQDLVDRFGGVVDAR